MYLRTASDFTSLGGIDIREGLSSAELDVNADCITQTNMGN